MLREPNILDYLPAFIARVKEIVGHAEGENPELQLEWDAIEQAWNDQFLYTMGEYGIKRWEKIIGIIPHSTDTLEDRRMRIISILNSNVDFTYRRVYEHLVQMCGSDKALKMQYIAEIWTLQVRVSLYYKHMFRSMKEWLTEVIPLNIILDIDLIYNTHRILSRFTHRFLSQYTHLEVREEPLPGVEYIEY